MVKQRAEGGMGCGVSEMEKKRSLSISSIDITHIHTQIHTM